MHRETIQDTKYAIASLIIGLHVMAPSGLAQPVTACTPVPTEAISQVTDRLQATIAGGDLDAIAALYAEDAVLLPAMTEAPRTGRSAIRAYYAQFIGRHPLPTVTMRSVTTGCGMATEMGTARYRVTGVRKGTAMFVGGRYSMLLVERGGRWLIAHQSLSLTPQPNRRDRLAF